MCGQILPAVRLANTLGAATFGAALLASQIGSVEPPLGCAAMDHVYDATIAGLGGAPPPDRLCRSPTPPLPLPYIAIDLRKNMSILVSISARTPLSSS